MGETTPSFFALELLDGLLIFPCLRRPSAESCERTLSMSVISLLTCTQLYPQGKPENTRN